MNKYENIDIVDVTYDDDIVDEFIEDVNKISESLEDSSFAIIGDKELAVFALDSLTYIDCTPLINKVNLEKDDLYIVYVSRDCELYVQPLSEFEFSEYVDKVYIDANSGIEQSIIDKFINNDTNVVLFSAVGTDEETQKNVCKQNCTHCPKIKTDISLSKDHKGNIHGFSANQTTDSGHYSYSYYSSNKLTKDDISMLIKEFGL